MIRYNIFYQVHKALREMLYNTASLLQQSDVTNEEETEALLNQVEDVLYLFDKHAQTEDNFIIPAIEKHEPSVASLFAEEHIKDHELSARMRTLLDVFNSCATSPEKAQAASVIRYSFVEFLIFNLQHMAKEESKLNELLWKHYSDDELKGITQQIIGQVPTAAMEKYSMWMMRSLTNTEITEWLLEIKNNAPDFVFNNMVAMAEKVLPIARWNAVQETIIEGSLLS